MKNTNEAWHELSPQEMPKLQRALLPEAGFVQEGDELIFREDLLDGAFELLVKVGPEGKTFTLLMDKEAEAPYVLHLVENAAGAFVGQVRAAYEGVLARLGEKCGEHGAFHGRYVEEVLRYAREKYGDEIEYPWEDTDAAVVRCQATRKWYMLLMKILPVKIGLGGKNPIRVMNLHGTAEQVAALVDNERYFPGWHMNRKYWYTVCLDGSIPLEELQQRIDESYALAQTKSRKK